MLTPSFGRSFKTLCGKKPLDKHNRRLNTKIGQTGILICCNTCMCLTTHMMLALCTAVTRRRPFSLANLKAYSAIRRELFRVMIFRDSTTPGTLYHKHRDLNHFHTVV